MVIIIIKQLKDRNAYKIEINAPQDIYYIDKLIVEGDVIKVVDYRTTSKGERGEKRKVKLGIEVEKIKEDYENKSVRVLGKIVEAPEDVALGYHSYDIREGSSFVLVKKHVTHLFLELLKRAITLKKHRILIVVMDNKEATFGLVEGNKLQELFSIRNKSKKGIEDNEQYYNEILNALKEMCGKYDSIILAGPGFVKDEISKRLKECKHILGESSITGIVGLKEVVKRGYVSRAIREIAVEKEVKDIEEFFKLLSKGSNTIMYGIKDIKEAASIGAVEKSYVCLESLKHEEIREIVEKVMEHKGKIVIIDDLNPYYEQIKSFGGAIAFLRFPV